MVALFVVGIIEMLIVTAWTETVTRTRVLQSGAITMLNILIWYYVLNKVINDIENFNLILVYAFGCSLGTMAGTYGIAKRDERGLVLNQNSVANS